MPLQASRLSSARLLTGERRYFDYQVAVGRDAIVPWLRRHLDLEGLRIADFGSHAGGVLEALRAAGAASGTGYELDEEIVRSSPFRADDRFRLVAADVRALPRGEPVDLVVLHDVLEHIERPADVLRAAASRLAPGGRVFVAFPPYFSGFGGHQQLAKGVARIVPFVHFLPARLFFRVAMPGENEYMPQAASLKDLRSVRRARLTLGRAERAFAAAGLAIVARQLSLVRPEHAVRYWIRAVGAGPVGRMPVLREVLVSGAYFLLTTEQEQRPP